MGRHASADRRRRVAAWPIVVAVVVVLLVGATIAYFGVLRSGDKATCIGTTVLPVVASSGAAPAVDAAAKAFSATVPTARSTCVSVVVTTLDGAVISTALAAGWQGRHSPAPGMWVADSAADVAALDGAQSALTAGHSGPLATSPVVLAEANKSAATSVSWASIAAGSAGPVMAVPDPATNRASFAALESLVAAHSTPGGSTQAIDTSAVAAASPVLVRLAAIAPKAPATTDLALAELAGGRAQYAAVPVLESDLVSFNRTTPAPLTAAHPSGPTAGVQVITVPLTASWVSRAMSDAAATFDSYLRSPPGLVLLQTAGLRTGSARAGSSTTGGDGGESSTPVPTLPDAGPGTRSALVAAWTAAASGTSPSRADTSSPATTGSANTTPSTTVGPTTVAPSAFGTTVVGPAAPDTTTARSSATSAQATAASTGLIPILGPSSTPKTPGPAITFLVDISMSMRTSTAGAQRLTWVKSAVSTAVQTGSTSWFGFWSFNATASQLVPLGPATQPVDGLIRPAAIITAMNALVPAGDSSTYAAIQSAFTDAVDHAVAGRANRLVVLTDGPDSTPGLSRDALKAAIAGLAGRSNGVVLDIVGLSSDVDSTALTEIAHAGGGSFTLVTSLDHLEPTLLGLVA